MHFCPQEAAMVFSVAGWLLMVWRSRVTPKIFRGGS